MKRWALANHADDDGRLTNATDAEFLASKIRPDHLLDFTGVAGVSPEFLRLLFAHQPADTLIASAVGGCPEVKATLTAFLGAPAAAPPAPRPPASAPEPPEPAFERTVEARHRYTPSRLVAKLREQLTHYIESAYPLSDGSLIRSRRRLLKEHDEGHLLAQEPFVETTPRYRGHEGGYLSLGLPAHQAAFLDELTRTPRDHGEGPLLYPALYEHQAKAFQQYLSHRSDLVVATGTGSGKTECFLIPLAASLWHEAHTDPSSFEQRGVRSLILYPMNALVNDQLARLRVLLGSERLAARFRDLPAGRHPLFGMYTGRTPYAGPRNPGKDASRVAPLLENYLQMPSRISAVLKEKGRYPAKDLEAFLAAHEAEATTFKTGDKAGRPRIKHHWERRLRTGPGDRELLTRHEMIRASPRRKGSGEAASAGGNAPDVLITNYSMLEYMLMRPFERPIFEQTRAWLERPGSQFLLVLDEAHMYRGAKGAEIAFLVRRLCGRLGILGKPEKLRVIATSASLGGKDAETTARNFAADLTGKPPGSFAVVFGTREKPSPVAPGDETTASALASVDLSQLHEAHGQDEARRAALQSTLEPLWKALGARVALDEASLPTTLHKLLAGKPWVNKVLDLTAGEAVPLRELAEQTFPGHPEARKATEVLLSLGTLARPAPGEPSLLPSRIHMMFRGLAGIYACTNPSCHGLLASEANGETGSRGGAGGQRPVGKLFVTPRALCDDCGSRVLELASCRSCGVAYLLGYVPQKQVEEATFLWGEGQGDLEQVHVLPARPRNEEAAEEVLFQLATGQLADAQHQGCAGVRSVWLPRSGGKRVARFERCPVCQPQGSQRKTLISDMRTRGEQPFTALIEAQFSEQPPQVLGRADLPNQGRKILVFSDGRQKAARLAPALETSHNDDAFRQVLLLSCELLAKQPDPSPRISRLYPAAVKVCVTRGIDLFPERDEGLFHADLARAKHLPLEHLSQLAQPTRSFARALYRELIDRFYSAQAMGLATLEEEPLLGYVFQKAPAIGASEGELRAVLRAWLRVQIERRVFLPRGASLEELGDKWDQPEGIDPDNPSDLLPIRFVEFLRLRFSERDVQSLRGWFRYVCTDSGLLAPTNDRYFLSEAGLVLRPRLTHDWHRCMSCGRLEAFPLRDRCVECRGELRSASEDPLYLDAKVGYYREQVLRAMSGRALEPFGLTTAEHSAQLGSTSDEDAFSRTERYELRFQDIPIDNEPPIDVLSCTTTMEVGIDIGALTGVALRNVPPHVANYQQRAGRAGRRGKTIASVVTYAQGGSHDAWFYEHPEKMISGSVLPPAVYTENLEVLRRHVSAYLVQRFFHDTVPDDGKTYELFSSLGSVRDFLGTSGPCTFGAMEAWLRTHEVALIEELIAWIPEQSHSFGKPVKRHEVIPLAITHLLERIRNELPFDLAERAQNFALEQVELPPGPPLSDREKEALEMQLDEELLSALIERAILPRYAFPTDTVSFWVPAQRRAGANKHQREFDYQPQRDLQIALTEFAPGRDLTIDKFRFKGAALYNPYHPDIKPTLDAAHSYTSCDVCGYVALTAAQVREQCPICERSTLRSMDLVRPLGFAPDINARREIDRGGAVSYAGVSTPAKLEVQTVSGWDKELFNGRLQLLSRPQDLIVVNKGAEDRGFLICPVCGAAEPLNETARDGKLWDKGGKPRVHDSPTERGAKCVGAAAGPYFLGHQFRTDVLLLRLRVQPPVTCRVTDSPAETQDEPAQDGLILSGMPARSALTSLVEALCLSASRILQIDEGELAGNWNPVLGETQTAADLYLYDLLPGGAGYVHQIRRHLSAVLEETRAFLEACDCVASCHRCLRHYNNQRQHNLLDRHLALALLRHLQEGSTPQLSWAEQVEAVGPLHELLSLRGKRCERATSSDASCPAPLRVMEGGTETWILVHHPLVKVEHACEAALLEAASQFTPVVAIDAHTLTHDLPTALRRLQTIIKEA
jgi:ATP-dependent helicase YprA (DUF1998 family)